MTAQELPEAVAAQIAVAAPGAHELDALLGVASIAAHPSERPAPRALGGVSGRFADELLQAAMRVAAQAAEPS